MFWVLDDNFEGEPAQGGVEQLTDSALQRWKKENEPLTVVVTTSTPAESPCVTYRESREPPIGESSSEEEEEDNKEDPFEEKKSELVAFTLTHLHTVHHCSTI